MEDVCRLVDAMDKYIDSDGSQEYECGACAGRARACAACGVLGARDLTRAVREAHATLGARAADDARSDCEHFPFRSPTLCAALAAAPVTDIPCPCVCCTDGADVAGIGAVGCRTAECCRRHQTAAARVAALTQDPRDEDEADDEADALAGAIPAGAAAAAAPGVRPLPYFGGSPRGSPVGSDGSRDLSPEPMGMLGLSKRDWEADPTLCGGVCRSTPRAICWDCLTGRRLVCVPACRSPTADRRPPTAVRRQPRPICPPAGQPACLPACPPPAAVVGGGLCVVSAGSRGWMVVAMGVWGGARGGGLGCGGGRVSGAGASSVVSGTGLVSA